MDNYNGLNENANNNQPNNGYYGNYPVNDGNPNGSGQGNNGKKKKKSEYIFNDYELEKFKKNKNRKILEIQRYKGLGEMDASQLWETTLDPKTRSLARIDISDTVEADEVTSLLMSSVVPPRREFIINEARYAKVDI